MTDAWFPDLARTPGAKYQAIADALGAAVESGTLHKGDRLPPQRELAAKLGVDLTTVTKAYDVARGRGLIEARGRSGSFVRDTRKVAVGGRSQPDTGMNMPPDVSGGLLARAMIETSAALLQGETATQLQYQPAGGSLYDRAAAARLLARAGLAPAEGQVAEEQIIVAAGGQNALHAILGSILQPGDAVACGRFVYTGFKALAERLRLRLVPLDEMSAAALDDACAREPIKALYIVPTNDNPTTLTIDRAERIAIAAVAQRRNLEVIEDDAYGALAAEPIAPIASFAPERCWYVASLSKTISPALRVAFIHAPNVGSALRLAADVHETAIMAPPLNAAMVTAWIDDGTYEELLGAMRAECAWRQALAAATLRDLPYRGHPEGYHLWLPLENGVTARDLVDAMRPTGLSVIEADRFAIAPTDAQAVRVSLGGLLDRERLGRVLPLLQAHVAAPLRRTSVFI